MSDYRDREWLQRHYVELGLSARDCGARSMPPVAAMTILGWLRRLGIPSRPVGEHMRDARNWRRGKPLDPATKAKISANHRGVKRSEESRKKQSESIRGANSVRWGKPPAHGRALRVSVGGGRPIAMRSRWEVAFADWLCARGMSWLYEPEQFQLPDGSGYTPDFLVDGVLYEVRGWMTPQKAEKIAAFRRAYPDRPLIVADRAFLEERGIPTGRDCLESLRHITVEEIERRTCRTCHGSFAPKDPRQLYCDLDCYKARPRVSPKQPSVPIVCEVCGTTVLHWPGRAAVQRTCSRRCGRVLAGRKTRGASHWTARRRAA